MKEQILKKLKELRLEKDVKPMVLAEYLGIDESTYLRMEKGTNNTWGDYLFKILDFYKVDPAMFFSDIEGKNFIQQSITQENKDTAVGSIGGVIEKIEFDQKPMDNLIRAKDEIIHSEREQKLAEREQKEYFKDKYYRAKEKIKDLEIKLKLVELKDNNGG
jgi:transcriptional regulator with XRE-family HTH domain